MEHSKPFRPSVSSINRNVSDDHGSPYNEESYNIENDIYSLPHFFASLFATILEDSISQISLIVQGNATLSLLKTYVDLNHLRALKYNVEQPAYKDELDGIDVKNLGCNDYKVNKLDADRMLLQQTFITLYIDMSMYKSFRTVAAKAKVMADRDSYYPNLIEDEAKNRMNRRELVKQLRQLRNHIKSVYYDTDSIIQELKTNVEDAALNAEIRSRYVKSWQRARTEQNDETIRLKERTPLGQIEYYKQRSEHEHRVHTEIDLLINITINETLAKVDSWMSKYDKDIEAMDLKIQIMKNNYDTILDKRENLEKTIEEHAMLIKKWVDFKDAREKARLYREKMTNAAITVQSWWRGLLVRNQLGPYKPQPKKKGAPAEKEKGKKKK